MAQLDYIVIKHLGIRLGINLTKTVGIGAPNLPKDVAALQAMFTIIAKGMGKDKLGFPPTLPLPDISGEYDGFTHLAVMKYQTQFRNRLLSGRNYDSRFHPASYQGRVIRHPRKPLMAITLMHIQAGFGDWSHPAGYEYTGTLRLLVARWGTLQMPQYERPSGMGLMVAGDF
jgi:hypothetical protein